jgi:hypothetical protein
MKIISRYFLFLMCLFVACQKNNTNSANNGNGNNPGNGGNGGNGGGVDTISISSFSPAIPYTTDTVTITGTGFNADKSKDSVSFSTPGASYGRGPVNIVSATSTQLRFVMSPDSVSGLMRFGTDGVVDLQISANGKSKYFTRVLRFKMSLSLSGIRGSSIPVTRPGDSIAFVGRGFSWTGNVFSINSQVFNILKMDSTIEVPGEYAAQFYAFSYLPKGFFGDINNEDSTRLVPVSVTNADGRTASIQMALGLSPIMQLNSMYFDNDNFVGGVHYFSISQLNNGGGKISLHIIGKNLKDNADVEFSGTDGTDIHSALPVSGFPDSTVIQFGTGGLTPGNTYTIRVRANNSSQGNTFYGYQSFFAKQ